MADITLGAGHQDHLFLRDGTSNAITDFRSIYFAASLDEDQEVPANPDTSAEGTGVGVLNFAHTRFSFSLALTDIDLDGDQTPGTTQDDMTDMHIHGPAAPGATADVIFAFRNDAETIVNPAAGTVAGGWDAVEAAGVGNLTAARVTSLINGQTYFNVHTVLDPSGQIRGQILTQDQGLDRIDLTAQNIGSLATLLLVTDNVGGDAVITTFLNGVASVLTLDGLIESDFLSEFFVFAGDVNQTINGTGNRDDLFGAGGNDSANGAGGDDRLFGETGADTLNGGVGADTLTGGSDNDRYIVDQQADIIVEIDGEGANVLLSPSSSYTLAAGVAVETMGTGNAGGATVIDFTGNEFGQLIMGNAAANRLEGKGGIDTLQGFAGNDRYIVDQAGDIIIEVAGEGANDVVISALSSYTLAAGVSVETLHTGNAGGTTVIDFTGNEFGQLIMGNAAANRLEGKGGIDTLQGFAGNDTYVVDQPGDIIVEVAGEGANDVVISALSSYTLAAGVAVETMGTGNAGGATVIDFTGNEFSQLIMGNAAVNRLEGKGGIDTLQGFAGNDRYIVDQAGDIIVEVAGEGANDVVISALSSYTLATGVAVETLHTGNAGGTTVIDFTGNEFGQLIMGNAAANRLEGKGGIDTLQGFAGNDRYIVDQAGDIIIEVAGEGANDVVISALSSYTLAAGVAVETLHTGNAGGTTVIDFTGNEFGQVISGNAAANRLEGKGGIDTLQGFAGNDTFVFLDGDGADTVNDFANNGVEKFDLSGLVTGAQNFGQLVVTDTAGPGVTVNYGTGSFLVANINSTALIDTGDFLF